MPLLGTMTVKKATSLLGPSRDRVLAGVCGLSIEDIETELDGSAQHAHVRTALVAHWPEDTSDELMEYTAAAALVIEPWPELVETTGWSEYALRSVITDAHPHKKLRNLKLWSSAQPPELDESEATIDDFSELTVQELIEFELTEAYAGAADLTPVELQGILAMTRKNTKVRNIKLTKLTRPPPPNVTPTIPLDRLASMTVHQAARMNLHQELSAATGLSLAVVYGTLQANGNMRLKNLFEFRGLPAASREPLVADVPSPERTEFSTEKLWAALNAASRENETAVVSTVVEHAKAGSDPADLPQHPEPGGRENAESPVPGPPHVGETIPRSSGLRPPKGLVIAGKKRQLILFVGAGASAAAGYPSWAELSTALLDEARDVGVSSEFIAEARHYLERGHNIDALTLLRSKMPLHSFEEEVEKLLSVEHGPLPELLRVIGEFEPYLKAIMTTNIDHLLLECFGGRWPELESDVPPRYLQLKEHFIFKLHGTLPRWDTWVITREDYDRAAYAAPKLRDAVRHLFATYTVLFVGYSLKDDDFDEMMKRTRALYRWQPSSHYALMPKSPNTHNKRTDLERAGVRCLEYEAPDGDHSACAHFLRNLLIELQRS